MDFEWLEKQQRELEKRFNPEFHKLNEWARQVELEELHKQLETPKICTADITPINKGALPQELWKDQKIKDLEQENKELKRKLAMHVLTYRNGDSI
ncbi:hypothetical protein [Acinetobacter baumannii]|uniref:hypothetical protein n=1 Tax=Acinetobacter baumannii TaxID=470 RepID=UPI000DEC746D|nr:hypothetical protein [Acinetobacter baumannii]EHU1961513.1 hypothetical protein [Acinetobacter baumannii]MBF8379858.1 hypothetical protein [Acinetobacter baumannii]MBJ3827435.1 hypothetical protein [Acinetobacter baumannii]MBP3075265.1 hypothetical protein [Acinetobacter baumannii]MBP5081283.1 hypothetical protein [Acinetobacter baumannii]